MRNWAITSIFSRFFAQGIGIVQSIIIIKILSVGDYGLIGLVASIIGIVGVTQNLGISSGATREVAATKSTKEAFKVFIGSLIVRYMITLPLALILFIVAPYLGNTYYNKPQIIFPLQLLALTMLIEATQNVFGSVIQGLKKFGFLFTFQAGIAIISLVLFVPLVMKFQFYGYYYANFLLQVIWSLIMFVYVFKLFKGNIEFPTKDELIKIIKAVFSIGLYVYVAKILYTLWQKMGPAIIAKSVGVNDLGIFNFGLFVAAKIIVVSDAITDVTLPSMTSIYEKYKDNFSEFKSIFNNVNSKSLFFITIASVFLIFFKEELFQIVDIIFSFVGKQPITEKYSQSFYLMTPMIVGFWAYSLINVLKSSLSIPTKKMWQVILVYSIMVSVTYIAYKFGTFSNLDLMYKFSISLLLGSIISWLVYLVLNKLYLDLVGITLYDFILVVISAGVIYLLVSNLANQYLLFLIYIFAFSVLYFLQFKPKSILLKK